MLITILTFILFTQSALAGLFLNYSLNYHTETDGGDTEAFNLARMNNNIFIGSTVDGPQKMIIGTNFASWNKTQSKGEGDTEKEISLLDMGLRFHLYMTQMRTWYLSATYNLYSRGTGTVNGETADFDGSGYMVSFGYHLKTSKRFSMGASIMYHSSTITSSIVDNTESEVTDTYTAIYPMIEMALRY